MVKIKLENDSEFFIVGELHIIAKLLNANKNKYILFTEDSKWIGEPEIGDKYFYADSIISFANYSKEKLEFL